MASISSNRLLSLKELADFMNQLSFRCLWSPLKVRLKTKSIQYYEMLMPPFHPPRTLNKNNNIGL
ncbi:unnamed protein product [Moneuplotes crassus]|uniref:Uncharacterized protein n=1 Tax=Euplotes crassus TaxID=5936 RepID=A0AAD1Y0V8_EUPCR|nr:unnamed protein product [Moneuplotes crassus]